MNSVEIRHYMDVDADSWLQCRLLSFFTTQYYDDVVIGRPLYASPAIQLVAVADDDVVGLLDIETSGAAATMEVVAVHPAHAREAWRRSS